MADSFSDVWRTVRLHVPGASYFLVQDWAQRAWKQLANTRPWSFLRGELSISINTNAIHTVTDAVGTLGSATLTSAAGSFLSTDVGRQLRGVRPYPLFTILTCPDAHTITLDRPWGDPTGTVSALIFDGYFTCPVDFGAFQLIGDPYNQRRLAFWIDQDQLNILDSTRQASDTGPRCLAIQSPSTLPSTLGQMRYEYWPRPTAQRTYPALYTKIPSTLTDDSVFSGVLYNAAVECLTLGALAQAAMWPGTNDTPNAYFNLNMAQMHGKLFRDEVQRLALLDDNQVSSDLPKVHWERWPFADLAYNDQSLRATDATLADMY